MDRNTDQRSLLREQIGNLFEKHDALIRELRDIKRQRLLLMQRAARIKLQIAQHGLSKL